MHKDNGLVGNGQHPFPESMKTRFHDAIWRHLDTMILL